MAKTQKYTAASIEVLSGLDPVRKNPGMFTDTETPLHLVQEVVDNSVDEALMGYATDIHIELNTAGWIEVADNGRGMPVDLHPEQKKSGVEVILTTLHAGGKFSDKHYQFSGGLHGVGVSVVNALSQHFEVEICREGKMYRMCFAKGAIDQTLKPVGKTPKQKTGTRIRFVPDQQFFESIEIPRAQLKQLLKTKAVLCPQLKIHYNDAVNQEQCRWCYTGGLENYFTERLAGQETIFSQHWVLQENQKDLKMDCLLNWFNDPAQVPITESYANLIETPRGGTHVNGLRTGIIAAVREFNKYHKLLPKNKPIRSEDITAGLSYLLTIRMHRPEFAGQTKERLNSRSVTARVHQLVHNALSLWLNRHTQQGKELLHLIALYAEQRKQEAAQKTTRKRVLSHLNLPAKLSDCIAQNVEQTELFLVEGNSAGGSAKQARDKNFQAILPLRGKIMNTWEASTSQIFDSEEIANIARTIGVEAGSNDLSKLRYGKICILADADSDGLHIASLLVALFKKHFPAIVEQGYLYVALPPLFRIDMPAETRYATNEKEMQYYLKKLSPAQREKVRITRFKGLGEMNAAQLKESVMSSQARRLLRLSSDTDKDEKLLDMLFTKSRSGDRRSWLEKNGNLATDLL